jgi:hypothetical protein
MNQYETLVNLIEQHLTLVHQLDTLSNIYNLTTYEESELRTITQLLYDEKILLLKRTNKRIALLRHQGGDFYGI